jgi:hypothetical protein
MDDTLKALLLAGLMGMVGQGARAIVGLKSVADQAAAQGLDSADLFRAARLAVSLMIGFVAGVAAAFLLGIDKIVAVTAANSQVLLGLAAAGYAGTDAIEGFVSRYLPGQTVVPGPSAKLNSGAEPAGSGDVGVRLDAMPSQLAALRGDATAPKGHDDAIDGSTYPASALARDIKLARSNYWAFILEGAKTYGLSVAVIGAIGSKESQWGLALRPPGPGGAGDWTARNLAKWGSAMPTDGLGWGRGLMQIDWYSNPFARSGDWRDPRANILFGCELLAGKIKTSAASGTDADTALKCGVSAYNGMSGPDSTYSRDVMARAAWITRQGLDREDAAA